MPLIAVALCLASALAYAAAAVMQERLAGLGEQIAGGTVGIAMAGLSALAAGLGVALLSHARAGAIVPVGNAYAGWKTANI
ncbi:hypothetical protein AB0M36_33715 [Actinoplanes sp. NPDC051346]|uniref:hypothetical protein n=1 Tax=Actinoplanes sp. NPDC051346 TaxID=3155048 RepID=UPI003416447F